MSCSLSMCLSVPACCTWREGTASQQVGATDVSGNASSQLPSLQGVADVSEKARGASLSEAGPDLGVAIMLLGSVAFMMAVFYLVNHSDHHIQRYTWKVINTTVSIFSSVLIFQACDKNLNDILDLENKSCWFEFVVDSVHGAFWFLCGEAILYGVSIHVQSGSESWSPLTYIFPAAKQDEDEKKFLKKLFSTYGTLSAHITGFAAIEAFGTLQQNLVHHCGISAIRIQQLVAIATTIFAGVVISTIMELAGVIRHKLFTFDGSDIDEYESEENEQAKEVENDVLGITVSFLLVQVIRFIVNGELPDAEGEVEVTGKLHRYAPFRRALALLAVAIMFAMLMVKKHGKFSHKHKRAKEYLKIIWSSSFAWSTYFALHWLNMANLGRLTDGQPAMFTVMVALTSTMVAFGMIFLLEKLESDMHTKKNKKHMENVILSLSILVGFAWERSFDVALDDIAKTASKSFAEGCPEGVIVLGLACVLALVVLPAWYMYILPAVIKLEQAIEEEVHGEEPHESGKSKIALLSNLEHAYWKLEEPLRSNQTRSNQSRSPRSPQAIESLSLEIPGDQFRSLAMQYHNLASRVANFRNQRLTGHPLGQGWNASQCAKSLAQFEAEATNMNQDLVHYRRLLEDRRMQQDNLEIGLNRMRMELHNEYLQLWGSHVAAG